RSRATEFSGKTIRRNLEFRHSVLRNVNERPAHSVVVIVRPVNRDIAAAPELTGRRDDDTACLGRIEVRRGSVAGNEQGEFVTVSRFAPVAFCVAVTFTPAITAPTVSVMRPLSVAAPAC